MLKLEPMNNNKDYKNFKNLNNNNNNNNSNSNNNNNLLINNHYMKRLRNMKSIEIFRVLTNRNKNS